MRVVNDVFLGSGQFINAVFQRDQTGLGKDRKDTAMVRNRVGRNDMRTIRQLIQ